MSTVNVGSQKIGWKFSTPLQADYLNTFMSGLTSPGLTIRPKMTVVGNDVAATVTINAFSLFIVPSDNDVNGSYNRMVKITLEGASNVQINKNCIAIGFQYRFKPAESPSGQSQWYGEFVAISDPSQANTFKGVIVATVIYNTTSRTYSLSTNGADISDCLLVEEGWNPNCWLSLISPRRFTGDNRLYNRLELRKHNDVWEGCVNGRAGCVKFDKANPLRWPFPTNENDPDGTKGAAIPNIYVLFKFTSLGLSDCEKGDAWPIAGTSGGVIAYGDKSPILQNANMCANYYDVKPVKSEDVNVWYDSSQKTIFIK